MNPEQLYDGITEIRDDLIEEPLTPKKPGAKRRWGRWAAGIAAALALILLLPNLGGGAGSGGQNGRIYMDYTGPVFPLDVPEETNLTATRLTDYDFSPTDGTIDHSYVDQYGKTVTYQYGGYEAIVTDSYTLTNPTDQPVTVTAVYPFAASLDEDLRALPRITVDGEPAETALRMGRTDDGLRYDGSWENYKTLLEDGSYRAEALGRGLNMDQPVVVYEIVEAEALEEAAAPTLQFTSEPAAGSYLMSYGSNGGAHDPEYGGIVRNFRISGTAAQCVVVLGDDILGYTIQCYRDGSCGEGKEIEATWDVRRYETTLGQLLKQFYQEYRTGWGRAAEPDILDSVPDKALLGQMAQFVERHGTEAADFPGWNLYDDLSDLINETENGQRVMYLTFEVTVPAHGQAEVHAAMHRKAHSDFTGKNRDRAGYDLVTQLGSSLTFTEQRASISNWENYKILDQNFGFDLKRGITEVTLDPAVESYWMDVRKK